MKYTIGIDYGTLSGRAVLAEVATGKVLASRTWEYPHGVMDTALPDGTPLPENWALQHPQDYLDVLDRTIPGLMTETGVPAEDVIGIGVDFTSSTTLPLDGAGEPLCFREEFAHVPHAYVKLWKHHAAQDQATRMTETAQQRGEDWLPVYGGKVSCEWALPKLWQVLEEAPEVCQGMAHWMEAGDWIVYRLCGRLGQSACAAGYKSFYRVEEGGFPEEEYFAALDSRLPGLVKEKMSAPVIPVCGNAGGLTEQMARRLGLKPGIAVAACMVDAHACVPAAGMCRPGQMLAIIGTSACYMALADALKQVPGICGAVKDGILPGYWGYEAGQSCVGDLFAWAAERITPESYRQAAKTRGISIQQYLTELAQAQKPGAHGLVALDWWNGNRSVLMDSDLTGMLFGMTLNTRAEDIYRALIEATAFGAKMIVEAYDREGIRTDELLVTGGICQKNPMMMQIYADVLNMPVRIVSAEQGGALGSAIFAAAAAGAAAGGYDTAEEAIRAMASGSEKTYLPDSESRQAYTRLFEVYRTLHDYFGIEQRGLTYELAAIKRCSLNTDA